MGSIWLIRTLALLVPFTLLACGGRDDVVRLKTGAMITQVTLKGVTRFSKAQLLRHLHIGETTWIPFTPDYHLDDAVTALDRRRIEALYYAHGFHDTQVREIKVIPDDDEVHLVIEVEEGPQAKIDDLTFEWQGADQVETLERHAVEVHARIVEDGPFEIPALNDAIGTTRLALQMRGYPQAQVIGGAQVREGAQRADVTLQLNPGPRAKVGMIRFEGLRAVPTYLVEREVRFAYGLRFSPGVTAQIKRAVSGMSIFRWVTVDIDGPVHEGIIDLVVRLSEAQPQSIRVGTGVTFEATRWEEWVSTRYIHTNIFGHLTKLDMRTIAGYAELPNPLSPIEHGPILKFRPQLTKKGLLEDYLTWSLRPQVELNIREGYQFWSPSNSVGVSRWFAGFIRGDISHNIAYVDFFNLSPRFDASGSILGLDFRDPYLLSFLQFKIDLHFVDSVLDPKNGTVIELAYDFAGNVLGGDYDYHKLVATDRAYWHPYKRLQLAARASIGTIIPYGSGRNAAAPFDRKLYLGGATDVRGWGTRRLSPRLCKEGETVCTGVPIGGYSFVQSNVEARFEFFPRWTFVTFFDMGDTQVDELTWVPGDWNYVVGPGLRWDSPLGKFRLDAGVRLNDPGTHPGEPGFAAHFGLGETF